MMALGQSLSPRVVPRKETRSSAHWNKGGIKRDTRKKLSSTLAYLCQRFFQYDDVPGCPEHLPHN